MHRPGRTHWIALGFACAAALSAPAAAQDRAESSNMALVGHSDLQARTAYMPTIRQQGNRWIAYVGHHGDEKINPLNNQVEHNGTSIVDVTDPKNPRYVAHIPGDVGRAEQGGAQMVRVCSGDELPKGVKGRFYMLRTFGNQAHEIWDTTEPEKPQLVTTVVKGLKGTHKNWWECDTGIAFLISGEPTWRTTRMTQVYDLSDPTKPMFIRNFGLVGQEPGGSGKVPTSLHGPISTGPKGNRVYFGYGTNVNGVLQIVDREKLLNGPKEPTAENLLFPQVARVDLMPGNGAHTTFPLLGVDVEDFKHSKESKRDFVVITNESILKQCLEFRQMVLIVDVTHESRPMGVSNYSVPEASGNFCTRGGRFGSHASNEAMTSVYHKRIMFFSWFNAGVRALDVRDPYRPREIGYYIPAMTDKTVVLETPKGRRGEKGGETEVANKVVVQTNNVEVDERGYIYIVDRANTGMHILELTGPARAIANWPK